MGVFSKQDYALINLGVCIKQQAERLGIEHDGVPLEGVVVRIAERALAAGVVAEEPERRAPVQASRGLDAGPAGTIAWSEHLEVWQVYAQRYGSQQDAERIAARGGFGFGEIVLFTGHRPRTFEPVKQEGAEQ